MMYNYVPGPALFKDHPDMVQVIIILFVICNLLILALGNITSILFARFAALPKSWIGTAVIAFSLVGSYALNNSTFDMFVCVAAGVMGFFFQNGGFPMGPMVLALILGKMVESNLSRSLLLSKGSYAIFFTRSISVVLLLLTVMVLAGPKILEYIKEALKSRKARP
jgi:putative tricarboxylic transport membrane protein